MWLIAEFEAVTLFSLKMSTATASGGKTLLVPTPYAVKMALLDIACRHFGAAEAENRWPEIRDLQVSLRPAERVVVTNLFQKVLRPRRNAISIEEPDAGYFQRTIGYREYVYFEGPFAIALGWNTDLPRPWLVDLFAQVSYLGKRGSFIQMLGIPEYSEALLPTFTALTEESSEFSIAGTLQLLDDCTPELTFAKANIYSSQAVRLGKERILRNIILPYHQTKSSRSFTLYERESIEH